MKITDEQLRFLNELKCERLSSDSKNLNAIAGFTNARNPNLVMTLKESAWEEDSEGSIAYYIVKTQQEDPLLFFSLKCGSLITNINPKEIKERKDRLLYLLDVLKNPDTKDKELTREAIMEILIHHWVLANLN